MLLLWGAEDGVVPAAMADDACASLGTKVTDKRQVVFDCAAHAPMFEAAQRFESEVRSFLGQIRRIHR